MSKREKGETIWTSAYISIFVANALLNLGQQMCNTMVAKYADYLGTAASLVGLLSGMFAATALLFRIVSGPAIDSFSRKWILVISMGVMFVSYMGYGLSNSVGGLITFRLIEGVAKAFTATACLAIASDTLPPSKFGSGIGIFTLSQAACQAISPTLGLFLARKIGYNLTFFFAALCVVVACIFTLIMKMPERPDRPKFKINFQNVVAVQAIVPASLLFLLSGTYFTVTSFLAIYGTDMGIVNIGFFFTVYACTMMVSRPLIGALTDKFGMVKVVIPSMGAFALSFYLISISTTLGMFLFAAVVAAFGYGCAQPAIQTLCMKAVPAERRGAGGNTAYIGTDLSNLVMPTLAGFLIQIVGYQLMWRFMIIPMAAAVAIMLGFRKRIAGIEQDFREREGGE